MKWQTKPSVCMYACLSVHHKRGVYKSGDSYISSLINALFKGLLYQGLYKVSLVTRSLRTSAVTVNRTEPKLRLF